MFRLKRILPIILIMALVVSVLASCAASSEATAQDRNLMVSETYAGAMPAVEMADQAMGKSIAPAMEPGQPSGSVQNTNRKIIKDASLGMEVVDVKASYDKLLAFALAHNGYETMRNEYKDQNYLTLYATIRIDPTQLDAFMEYAATVGELINVSISTNDITESYYDTTTRLATMEKSLARYDSFMLKAETIEEVLQVQAQINQITTEIESMKGMLRLWDGLLDESTISLQISQVDDPVQIKKEITWSALSWADMIYLMKSGLTWLANGLVTTIQWIAIALAVTTPVWLIALIVILVIRRKRSKAQKAAAKASAVKPEEQVTKD
ncbi:MAG: DUF4349 domain-containing protein [Eubacteriales bacterium]|nr:DUF4349 domain-containing protein [Eubacteriales bacterium]